MRIISLKNPLIPNEAQYVFHRVRNWEDFKWQWENEINRFTRDFAFSERVGVVVAVSLRLADELPDQFNFGLGDPDGQGVVAHVAHGLQHFRPVGSGSCSGQPELRRQGPANARRRHLDRVCREQHSHLLWPSHEPHGPKHQLCRSSHGLHERCCQCVQHRRTSHSQRHGSRCGEWLCIIYMYCHADWYRIIDSLGSTSQAWTHWESFIFLLTGEREAVEQYLLPNSRILRTWCSGFLTLWLY